MFYAKASLLWEAPVVPDVYTIILVCLHLFPKSFFPNRDGISPAYLFFLSPDLGMLVMIGSLYFLTPFMSMTIALLKQAKLTLRSPVSIQRTYLSQ